MGDRFELTTQRLTLRMLGRADIAEFTRYRNLDVVARYQDWPLPYTRDLAHELIDEMERVDGPTAGTWAQIAMTRDGLLVGDIAVWLDDTSELAMLGYTVAPEHQGRGYAVEAANAVLVYLFEHIRVHRVAATIDPRNMASARVLERCGFEYVGTARSSAWSRGAWTDDARFSLLATDWRAWVARPTGAPATVEFTAVDASNVHAVCAIAVAHSQRRFVRSPAESIADTAHPPLVHGVPLEPWYRAIRADGDLAGFLLVSASSSTRPTPHLWQLLVDQRHQRRGIARRAIGELARLLLADGHTQLTAAFVDEPGGPEAFYRALGFERTDEIDVVSGQVLAKASLRSLADIRR
jgi:RimJ/RimL family protein N-acetyltransferase